MLLGVPTTWLISELLAGILFVLCIAHAVRTSPGRPARLFELLAFVLYAGIYENVGVAVKVYDYSVHRLLMFGRVPLGVLMLEAIIFYAALRLAEHVRLPAWGAPIVVGLLGSVQDLTIDPTAVFDFHTFDGVATGQWNWAEQYDGSFFGIPYFNFSGWMTMMVYFAAALAFLQWLQGRGHWRWMREAYPFVGVLIALVILVSPINQFLLWGNPIFGRGLGSELGFLIFNYAVGLVVLFRFWKPDTALDLRRDWVVFVVPVVLHLYDIVVAYAVGIPNGYVPSVVVAVLHLAFLAVVIRRGQRATESTPALAEVGQA